MEPCTLRVRCVCAGEDEYSRVDDVSSEGAEAAEYRSISAAPGPDDSACEAATVSESASSANGSGPPSGGHGVNEVAAVGGGITATVDKRPADVVSQDSSGAEGALASQRDGQQGVTPLAHLPVVAPVGRPATTETTTPLPTAPSAAATSSVAVTSSPVDLGSAPSADEALPMGTGDIDVAPMEISISSHMVPANDVKTVRGCEAAAVKLEAVPIQRPLPGAAGGLAREGSPPPTVTNGVGAQSPMVPSNARPPAAAQAASPLETSGEMASAPAPPPGVMRAPLAPALACGGSDTSANAVAAAAAAAAATAAADPRPHVRALKLLNASVDCLLCRAAAAIAKVAAHPHAPPFSAPVDRALFPDYAARMPRQMDLRTAAEKLARGAYPFGVSGDAPTAVAAVRADVLVIWANARAYNSPRSCVVRMLHELESEFDAAWDAWVIRRSDGWKEWLRASAAAICPIPSGGRLPSIVTSTPTPPKVPRPRRQFVAPPPPTLSEAEIAGLSVAERQVTMRPP